MASSMDEYGVAVTVQGFNLFIQQMGAAANATTKLGVTIKQTTSQINNFGSVNTAVSGLPSAANVAAGALGGLSGVLKGVLAVAGGILAAGIFKKLAQEIGQLVGAAFRGAAGFQTLQFRLEGLVARQLRAADHSLTLAESLDIAAGAAKGYLKWVQDLSLASPFATADVAQVFSLAQAYDFTAEEAKKLTVSVTDFAAGMGLTGQEMKRIIENFGQMRAAGKVTGTELRDLARGAFVPVNDILHRMAVNMGVAAADFEDFKQEAKTGGADVNEFFKAFSQLVDEDFAGAAKRMSRTWAGVSNNIRDFIETVLGMQVLGPVLQRFTNIAADALDVLLSQEVRNNATLFGQALADSFDKIWGAISGELIPALQQLAAAFGLSAPSITGVISLLSKFTTTVASVISSVASFISTVGVDIAGKITEVATNAYEWGANIVRQLATGIIQGGANFLVAAMQWIGQLLANWLQPGSPPKVALDILKWGAGTFEEYLHGFAKADFSILNDLQSPLKSALDILVQAGALGETQSANMFASISESIAEAIANFNATGEINDGVFDALNGKANAFGDELQTLLELELQYQAAVEAVEQAQAALNAAQENQRAAQVQVKGLTEEYNRLLRAGADESVLRAKLAEINASEEARDLATEQAHAAEEALANAQDAVDPIQDQIDAQRELIAQLLELARIQADTIPPEDDPAGGGGGIDLPPIDPPDVDISPLTDVFRDFTSFLDGWAAETVSQIGTFFANLIQSLIDAWNRLVELFKQTGLLEIWGSIFTSMYNIAVIVWGIITEFIGGGLETLANLWDKHKGKVEGIWRTLFNLVSGIALDVLLLVSENVAQRLKEIEEFFEKNRGKISTTIDLFWKNFETVSDRALNTVLGFVQERLDAMQRIWDEHSPKFLGAIDSMWDTASEIFGTVMQELLDTVYQGQLSIEQFWRDHGASVDTILNLASEGWGRIIDLGMTTLSGIITGFFTTTASGWEESKETVKRIIQNTFDALRDIFDNSLNNILGGIVDTWAAALTGDFDLLKAGLEEIVNGMWANIETAFTTAKDNILEIIRFFTGDTKDEFNALSKELVGESIIPDMLSDIESVFSTILGRISEALSLEFIDVVKEKWTTFLEDIKAKVELWETDIKSTWNTLWENVKTAIATKWDEIKTAFNTWLEFDLLQAVRDFINDFYTAGKNLVMGIINGMMSQGTAMYNALKNLILNAINDALGAVGLPPIDTGGGGGSGSGGGAGGGTGYDQVAAGYAATNNAQAAQALAPTAYRVQAPGTVKNVYIHVETTIKDGMDAAEYKAFIRQTLDEYIG